MQPDARPSAAPPVARKIARAPGRRIRLAAAAACIVAAGLVLTQIGRGPVAGIVGDSLYAALVYLLVAVVAPGARAGRVAAIAVATCAGIELAQLTGVPAVLVASWPPARYLLGTTFQALDLAAYAGGALLVCLLDRATSRRVLPGKSGRDG